MKTRKNLPNWGNRLYWAIVAAAFLCACLFITGRFYRKYQEKENKRIERTIHLMIALETQRSSAVDPWWMRTNPPATLASRALLESKKAHIMALVQAHRDISAETRRLADRFDEVKTGAFVNGKFQYMLENDVPQEPKGKAIGLCFVPEDVCQRSLNYVPAWRTTQNLISIPAVDIPDKIMAGVIFHELGHALRHNMADGNPPDDTLVGSRPHTLEEVEMHELGGSVFNALTNGAYFRIVDRVAARFTKEHRLDRAIASIPETDLMELKDLFECGYGEAPRAVLLSQFILLVGFRMTDARGMGEDGKIMVYRWSQGHFKPLEL